MVSIALAAKAKIADKADLFKKIRLVAIQPPIRVEKPASADTIIALPTPVSYFLFVAVFGGFLVVFERRLSVTSVDFVTSIGTFEEID